MLGGTWSNACEVWHEGARSTKIMPEHYHRAASRTDLTPNALFRPYQRRKCCRFCDRVSRSLRRSVQRNHRIFVAAVAHGAFGEDAVAGDPVEGLGVGFLGVGLEDQALAGTPAAGVHLRVEALGEFVPVIMRVAVGAQVEVALRTA